MISSRPNAALHIQYNSHEYEETTQKEESRRDEGDVCCCAMVDLSHPHRTRSSPHSWRALVPTEGKPTLLVVHTAVFILDYYKIKSLFKIFIWLDRSFNVATSK